jgi:ABC-type multidrug transport system permease subunit
VALLVHMHVGGSGVDLVGLYTLAIIVNISGLLWACGIAMRFRSVQAGPLMQTPIFILLFLSPVYVPLALLQGWIHNVARLNPLTYILTSGRGFISGDPTDAAIAFTIAFAMLGVVGFWGLRGLKRAEQVV